jgi:hypothetical protein
MTPETFAKAEELRMEIKDKELAIEQLKIIQKSFDKETGSVAVSIYPKGGAATIRASTRNPDRLLKLLIQENIDELKDLEKAFKAL